MEMVKLLIADANEEFRMALSEQLEGTYQVRTARDGVEAMELLHTCRPDILVLDLMLPELDGISLLERAAAEGIQPIVLVVTRLQTDYVLEQMSRLQVAYMMMKPCEIKATANRITEMTQQLSKPVFAPPDPRNVVSNMLLALSIPPKLDGFSYLRETIVESARNPGQQLFKELYPKAGAYRNADARQVERCIRTAIEKGWLHRDDRIWRLYFPAEGGSPPKKPSNAVFISCLVAQLDRNGPRREG